MTVCVRLTYYIQLSHVGFDAAAVSSHTGVPARIICGDVRDHQGAIGHLLEPRRQRRSRLDEVQRSETKEKKKRGLERLNVHQKSPLKI